MKYFESKDKGVLWHVLDEEQAKLVIAEDIKPMDSSELVARCSYDSDAYFPFEIEQDVSGYMSEDLNFEDACGVIENGDAYGRFEIHLPKFNNKIEGYQAINKTLKSFYTSELKGKEDYYEDIKEGIKSGEVYGSNYFKGVYYYSVAVTDKYLCIY